jgi:quinol monooxygenase YgiN
MSNTVTVTVAMAVKPEAVATMLGMIPGLLTGMLERPGVLGGRALQNPAEPTKLLFIDEFETVEASEAYFKWRTERGDIDRLGALLTAPPQVQVWPANIPAG